jgi:hypothetical protein
MLTIEPLPARPIGDLAAETITASGITALPRVGTDLTRP